MTMIVLVSLWFTAALLAATAFAFGAAVGRRRGYEDARLQVRARQAPSGSFGPPARQRHGARPIRRH